MLCRSVVAVITERALLKFGDHSTFARRAFPHNVNPAWVWRSIRNARPTGKVRSLTVEDLESISSVLDIPVSELMLRAEQQLKTGWKPSDIVASCGRPRKKPAGEDVRDS